MSTQAAAAQGANTGSLTPENKSIVGDTAYAILELRDVAHEWLYSGETKARSAEQAIRKYVSGKKLEKPRTLVAVPARSWRPVTVSAEVTTTLKLEEAK